VVVVEDRGGGEDSRLNPAHLRGDAEAELSQEGVTTPVRPSRQCHYLRLAGRRVRRRVLNERVRGCRGQGSPRITATDPDDTGGLLLAQFLAVLERPVEVADFDGEVDVALGGSHVETRESRISKIAVSIAEVFGDGRFRLAAAARLLHRETAVRTREGHRVTRVGRSQRATSACRPAG